MPLDSASLPLMDAAFLDAPLLTGREAWKMATPAFDGAPVRVFWVNLGELWMPLADVAAAIKVPLANLRPRVPESAVLYLSSRATPHLPGVKRLLLVTVPTLRQVLRKRGEGEATRGLAWAEGLAAGLVPLVSAVAEACPEPVAEAGVPAVVAHPAAMPFVFEGAEVRVVMRDGDPWFVAKDVATLLGYADTAKAVKAHCKAYRPVGVGVSPTLDPQANIIPERDVYRLVMGSKLEGAERFEEWVVGEVLPSIRRDGGYMLARPKETAEELALRALTVLHSTVERQKAQLAAQAPDVAGMARLRAADGADPLRPPAPPGPGLRRRVQPDSLQSRHRPQGGDHGRHRERDRAPPAGAAAPDRRGAGRDHRGDQAARLPGGGEAVHDLDGGSH